MRAEVTFLGHSTVLVEMGGIRVLTDPVLFDRVNILRRAVSTLPAELYRDIDAVVISHLHLDHFDISSLRLLGKSTPLIVPRGAGRLLNSAGFSDVTELGVGASVVVSDLVITATPATHSGFRPPFGPTAEAIGYLLDHANERVYFAGDTDLFPEMVELTDIDLALLPVWGWGPRLGPGHMDPKRAAEALRVLRPTAAVPIHWGTLWPIGMGRVMTHLLEGPPVEFARYAAIEAPEVAVLLTPPGQTVSIPR